MPFTNAPSNDTYSTHQLSLSPGMVINPSNGVNTFVFLSGMTNVVPFEDGKNEHSETRYSVSLSQVANAYTNGSVVRGAYVWEKAIGQVYYYVALSDALVNTTDIYTSTDGTTWTKKITFTETNSDFLGPVRFTEFINQSNTKSLVMVTGTRGYVFTDASTFSQIVDADFPTPHVPFPVFIDSYLFLAKAGTGDIYNSDANNPTQWTAGNFISTELYPDDVQALVKIDNFLLAVGLQGCEYFYDAGNFPGSPLARQSGASLPFGTSYPNSIAYNKNTAVMLVNTNDGGVSLTAIEGFKYKTVEAEAQLQIFNYQMKNSILTRNGVRGMFTRMYGDLFYILNFRGDLSETSPNYYTFMYSMNSSKWCQLSGYAGASRQFPVYFSCAPVSSAPLGFLVGHDKNNGVFFGAFNPGVTTDNFGGTSYAVSQSILLSPVSFGTLNRKFMSRMGVGYNSDSPVTINIQWSDDSNKTFNTAVSLGSSINASDGFPFITQLGAFRQRGFLLSTSGGRIRYNYAEVDINKGQQ